MNLIPITSGKLTARINPLGAELWSLTDAKGRELMTDADPAFWTGHAPLLFPIVGCLRGDSYRVDGHEYALPKHGFARHSQFQLIEQDAISALFRLDADAETRRVYPFDFRLDMAFVLEETSLFMTATVVNQGRVDMPFSFGFHPAFAWPLPFGGDKAQHMLLFEEDEPAPIRRIGSVPGLIAPERFPSPVSNNVLLPTHEMFEGDALIWDQLASRRVRWGVPGRPSLDIGFPDTPWLGIWQKPGANYLCIEPWAGMADPEGFDGDIWMKPGIIRLAPGAQRQFQLNVRLVEN
jgi:galactose mutarotase-like enzyme